MRNVIRLLMVSGLLVLGMISVCNAADGDKKGAVEKKSRKSKSQVEKEPEVTYLDMSGKDEPESEFPTVSSKGKL